MPEAACIQPRDLCACSRVLEDWRHGVERQTEQAISQSGMRVPIEYWRLFTCALILQLS